MNPVARLPVVPRAAPPTAPVTVPVVLRATEAEAVGARMRVGGLRVVDRALRQLARLRDARVIVVTDGSVKLPRRLPGNMEVRTVERATDASSRALAVDLGPDTATVGADTVWIQPARFDRGVRVVDAASLRTATDAVFRDLQRDTVGIVNRLVNQKVSSGLARYLFTRLAISPTLITLIAGFVGLYGTLLIAGGGGQNVTTGFALLEGYAILSMCAGQLARLRLHQTALGAWLITVVGDFVNVVLILAVGLASWRHGGTYLDMKISFAAAGMTLVFMVISYRELMRQGEGDVMKLRWWFSYGQSLRSLSGAGSHSIKGVMLLGRQDFVILLSLALVVADQLPIVLLYLLIVATVRVGCALGQLLTPRWRIQPPP